MTSLNFDDLTEQLEWYSAAVSNAVRTTAFGVIAALWAIFTAQNLDLSETGLLATSTLVKMAFVFASSALLADMIQYIVVYWMTNICVDRFESKVQHSDEKDIDFFYNSDCMGLFGFFLYKLSFYLLTSKLILAIASALTFLTLAFTISWSPI